MERLTSNKPVSEMGMYELIHNSCYAKDGKARYRDYEDDFDTRELTIKLLKKYADIPNEFTCDEDFDEFMLDSLQYGTDDILGLIAVFYQNMWAMADLRERLAEYEDLEEQGKLMKLPCAVGDTVYKVSPYHVYVDTCQITGFAECDSIKTMCYTVYIDPDEDDVIALSDFGKTVFLTREEAEAALKEMEKSK